MFVQGTRDPLCPLDFLESVRKRMRAPSTLHIVDGADHSLLVAKATLKALGSSQEDADDQILKRHRPLPQRGARKPDLGGDPVEDLGHLRRGVSAHREGVYIAKFQT